MSFSSLQTIKMAKNKQFGISTFSARLTATISVALVLLILGIVAFLGIAAHSVSTDIKENMGFDLILKENTPQQEINKIKNIFTNSPYISSLSYISPEEALMWWQEETGQDLMEMVGYNPLPGEFEIKVKSQYANVDSIDAIVASIHDNPYIAEVATHTQVVESINDNMQSLSLILLVVAIALLIISFALINNTIRLAVYSRRFLIHTMKLVGATAGFIRRPFITTNIVNGIIASILAMMILTGLLFYIQSLDNSLNILLKWDIIAIVYAILLFLGILICAIAALFATNRYLRISYDDMFK